MSTPDRTSIVIPAFNEAAVIANVVRDLLAAGPWHEILVVDDGSSDGTTEKAAEAGATVVRHPYNKGNGAAVKSGIRRATGDNILILDGDGQHKPEDAMRLLSRLAEYDLVVGARSHATQASGARLAGNTILNWVASFLTSHEVLDLTSGFRAARREYLLEFLHLLPNGFSTPTTTTMCFLKAGYNVAFVPIEARARVGKSKIKLVRDGVKFFLILLRIVTIFSPLRIFLPISGAALAVGVAYGAWTAATQFKIPNGAVLLILFGIVVFLVGLVSEQISALRTEGRR